MTTQVHILSALHEVPDGQVPDWMHLLPAGTFGTRNGLGPFRADDLQGIIRASMADGKLVIDINHSTDLKAPKGEEAPAVGWITEMQAREDGIWGRTDFNRAGRHAMTEKHYRSQSPVIDSTKDGRVLRILRVALTNTPNLTLTTMHSETSMDQSEIRALLGLPSNATEADVRTALGAARTQTTLHSQIAQAIGADDGIAAPALLTALQARLAGETEAMTQLRQQVTDLTARESRASVERLLDSAAADGAAITQDMRNSMITLHSTNADLAATVIASWPRTQLQRGNVTMHSAAAPTQGNALLKSLASGFDLTVEAIQAEMERTHAA